MMWSLFSKCMFECYLSLCEAWVFVVSDFWNLKHVWNRCLLPLLNWWPCSLSLNSIWFNVYVFAWKVMILSLVVFDMFACLLYYSNNQFLAYTSIWPNTKLYTLQMAYMTCPNSLWSQFHDRPPSHPLNWPKSHFASTLHGQNTNLCPNSSCASLYTPYLIYLTCLEPPLPQKYIRPKNDLVTYSNFTFLASKDQILYHTSIWPNTKSYTPYMIFWTC